MTNTPYKTDIKAVTNDVISSKELNFKYEEEKNAWRLDKIVLLVLAHAGVVSADYIIAEVDYTDLKGDALADLLNPSHKEYIERQGIVWEVLGTNGSFAESVDLAKIPIVIRFENCFITQAEAFVNLLIHGLAAPRDCSMEIWGQYVELKKEVVEKFNSGVTL